MNLVKTAAASNAALMNTQANSLAAGMNNSNIIANVTDDMGLGNSNIIANVTDDMGLKNSNITGEFNIDEALNNSNITYGLNNIINTDLSKDLQTMIEINKKDPKTISTKDFEHINTFLTDALKHTTKDTDLYKDLQTMIEINKKDPKTISEAEVEYLKTINDKYTEILNNHDSIEEKGRNLQNTGDNETKEGTKKDKEGLEEDTTGWTKENILLATVASFACLCCCAKFIDEERLRLAEERLRLAEERNEEQQRAEIAANRQQRLAEAHEEQQRAEIAAAQGVPKLTAEQRLVNEIADEERNRRMTAQRAAAEKLAADSRQHAEQTRAKLIAAQSAKQVPRNPLNGQQHSIENINKQSDKNNKKSNYTETAGRRARNNNFMYNTQRIANTSTQKLIADNDIELGQIRLQEAPNNNSSGLIIPKTTTINNKPFQKQQNSAEAGI